MSLFPQNSTPSHPLEVMSHESNPIACIIRTTGYLCGHYTEIPEHHSECHHNPLRSHLQVEWQEAYAYTGVWPLVGPPPVFPTEDLSKIVLTRCETVVPRTEVSDFVCQWCFLKETQKSQRSKQFFKCSWKKGECEKVRSIPIIHHPATKWTLLLHKWYRSDPGNTRLPKETIQQRRKEWMQEEAYQKGVIHFKNLENWKQEFYFPLKRLEAERNLPIEDRLYLRNSEAEYSELLSYVAPEEVLMKNCTRCRRMLTYESARKLPCGHMFHMKCAQPRDRWGIKTCLKCRVQFHFMDLPDLNHDWKFPSFKSRHALGMFATDEEREVWMKACDWI